MARVELTADAREDIRDLDGSARKIVLKAIKKLETDPELRGTPLGSRNDGQDLTGLRKLVVGNRDYRVVFKVENDGTVVVVWVVAKRADDEVYALTMARLKTFAERAMAEKMETALAHLWDKNRR